MLRHGVKDPSPRMCRRAASLRDVLAAVCAAVCATMEDCEGYKASPICSIVKIGTVNSSARVS